MERKFKTSYLTFRAVGAVRCMYAHAVYGGAVVGFEFVEMTARGRADIAAFIRDQETVEFAKVA